MTFDTKSFSLAQHFLPDGTKEQQSELAADIQCAVENWFYDQRLQGNIERAIKLVPKPITPTTD